MSNTTTLKCNICGGLLKQINDHTFKCLSCDQTVYLSDDYIANRVEFEIASNDMLKLDFEGAALTYRKLLQTTPTLPEAYFGLLLCEMGVEYVTDFDGKKKPTFHDISPRSVMDNRNYLSALQYANPEQRELYVAQAEELEEVRKDIIALTNEKNGYDVFLCQKINRLGEQGVRTKEFEYSYRLYYELTKLGYKVFLSEVSLGGGVESDASIFAALYSSKVMILVCADEDNLNSPWVKSEWNRFYNMIVSGIKEKGSLVPIILDKDESVLPPKLRKLQALNIENPSYMDQLKATIKRYVVPPQSKQSEKSTDKGNSKTNSFGDLLVNASMCLNRKDFAGAKEYYTDYVSANPNLSPGYIGLLLCELGLDSEPLLATASVPLTNYNYFNLALTYANDTQRKTYEGYRDAVNERLASGDKNKYKDIYNDFGEKVRRSVNEFARQTGEVARQVKDGFVGAFNGKTDKQSDKPQQSSSQRNVYTVPYDKLNFNVGATKKQARHAVQPSVQKETFFETMGLIGMIISWFMFVVGVGLADASQSYGIVYVAIIFFCAFSLLKLASRLRHQGNLIAIFFALIGLAALVITCIVKDLSSVLSVLITIASIILAIGSASSARNKAKRNGEYIVYDADTEKSKKRTQGWLIALAIIVGIAVVVLIKELS